MKHSLFFALLLVFSQVGKSQTWSAVGTGITGGSNTSVYVMEKFNNELYVGGYFTAAGGIPANSIAKWNGTSWAAAGLGTNNSVRSLIVHNNELYVTGEFTTAGGSSANRVAKWNGSGWSTLGSGLNWTGRALALFGNDVYVGGGFTSAGGTTANRVAKWDGTQWSALGTGVVNGNVNALAVYNGELYVAGDFTVAGGNPVNQIARWNGTNWSSVGTGVSGGTNPEILAMAVYNGALYVSGIFTNAGGIIVNNIAKWNGTTWDSTGINLTGNGYSLLSHANHLYIGGSFPTIKWDGTTASTLGIYIGNVLALEELNSDIYAAGHMPVTWGSPSDHIAKWTSCTSAPSQPASISGSASPCTAGSQTYSVPAVGGASSYTWTLPAGWTGTSTTNSITTTVGPTGGNITVAAVNSCGTSVAQTLAVTVNTPPNPTITQAGNVLNAPGGFVSYQWYRNAVLLTGATNQSHTVTQSGSYYVVVTNSSNCSGQSNTLNVVITDVETVAEKREIFVYPNPVRRFLRIESGKMNIGPINIYDNMGRKVQAHQINSKTAQIDLQTLTAGVYFIVSPYHKEVIEVIKD